MNDFSVLAGKKFSIIDSSAQAINGFIGDNLINSKTASMTATDLKNPISVESYISSKGKTIQGNPSQVLNYVLSQTTSIPCGFVRCDNYGCSNDCFGGSYRKRE